MNLWVFFVTRRQTGLPVLRILEQPTEGRKFKKNLGLFLVAYKVGVWHGWSETNHGLAEILCLSSATQAALQ
jgi:hypothetical protein